MFYIDEIPIDYDYIMAANTYATEIYNERIKKELDIDKVIFIKNIVEQQGCKNLNIIEDISGEKNYTEYCYEYKLVVNTFWEKDVQKYDKLKTKF